MRSVGRQVEIAEPVTDVVTGFIDLVDDDIAATFAELRSKGVPFNSEPNTVDDGPLAGWRWVYFTDPDGHTMELVEVAYVRQAQRDADITAYIASRSSSRAFRPEEE